MNCVGVPFEREVEVTLTPTGQRLLDAMRAALDSDTWKRVPDQYALCIRFDVEDVPTPETIPTRWWGAPTYSRHQFLTFLSRTPIIWGVSGAPWVGRQDSRVSYRDAFEILADPEKYWSMGPTALRRQAEKEGVD